MLIAPVQPTAWSVLEGDPLLRRATPDDVVELAALKRRVERRCYAHLGTPQALAIRLHRRCTAWHLLTRIAEGDLLLVAEEDGELIGLGAARVDRHLRGPSLHLHSAYVERPGLGVGRALTRARLRAAADLGIGEVTADLLVGAYGTERRLQSLGMEEVGERTCSPTFPGVLLSHWTGSLHTALERLQ